MSDVRIADLKARLSEHLRSVRNGAPLIVLDRDKRLVGIVSLGDLATRMYAPEMVAETLEEISEAAAP